MKIELIKAEELSGETWFHLKIDGFTDQSTKDEQKAEEIYNRYVDRHKQGFPKMDTIKQFES